MSALVKEIIGGEAIKWIAYAFIALVSLIFLGLLIGFFGRIFFGLLFLVVGVVLATSLKTAFPKTSPAYLFGIFAVTLVFGFAVIAW